MIHPLRVASVYLVLTLTACTTTEVNRWVIPESAVDAAYIKPGVDFSVYRRLLPEPLEIYYPAELGKPDAEHLARLRQIFRDAFRAAIGDDYEIVNTRGADVLKVRASLVDLRTSESVALIDAGPRLSDIVTAGHLTLLMELIDSSSDEVLARAGDEEKPEPGTEFAGDVSDWDAVRNAAERWAGLFRTFLDNNLGRR